MRKTTLAAALGLVLGGASLSTQAALTSNTVLVFTAGVGSCSIGGTYPNCKSGASNVTAGSWFSMDADGNGSVAGPEKTPMQHDGGVLSTHDIHSGLGVGIHTTFDNTGNPIASHPGTITGAENGQYDIWEFFGNTGLDYTTKAITVVTDSGATKTLDFSGWTVTWNGIALIPMGGDPTNFGAADTGLATITCSASTCSVTSAFTLSYAAHVPLGDPSGFGGVPYTISMVGHVGESAVPIPAAAWLFGSGLVGLAAVARRKKKA